MLDWMRGYYAILDLSDLSAVSAVSAVSAAAGPSPGLLGDLAAFEARAARLLEAGPCCLQLRAKQVSAAALRSAAARLRVLCAQAGVPFCVNDRLDVALAVEADVVHLGQEDLPLEDARRVRALAGARDLLIGFSTHNREQALAAAAGGADYIGFGPVFGTGSKSNPDPTVGLPALAEVCAAVSVPVVAIGGITVENAPAVARAGAAAAAVIAAVDRSADPTAAGRAVGASWSRPTSAAGRSS